MPNKASNKKWERTFLKAVSYLKSAGVPAGKWSFGGGTALMFYYNHRFSKDIDIFLSDVQYLTALSPRLNDFVESDKDYSGAEEQSNFLKIKLKRDAFIDFIAAPFLTQKPVKRIKISGCLVNVETPQEIIIKKMFYRADQFKSRDIFDLAIVIENDPSGLMENISVFRDKLPVLLERCRLLEKVYREEIKQLIIYRDKRFVDCSFDRVMEFFESCAGK